MPIIDHNNIPETPWRPNYHKWDITRAGDGTTSSSASYSEIGVGAGAPLHTHEADEIIVILEGTVEARLGDDVQEVGANHTLVIPPNVPHGFTIVGDKTARLLTFFPIQDPFNHTTFLDGAPPEAHRD